MFFFFNSHCCVDVRAIWRNGNSLLIIINIISPQNETEPDEKRRKLLGILTETIQNKAIQTDDTPTICTHICFSRCCIICVWTTRKFTLIILYNCFLFCLFLVFIIKQFDTYLFTFNNFLEFSFYSGYRHVRHFVCLLSKLLFSYR